MAGMRSLRDCIGHGADTTQKCPPEAPSNALWCDREHHAAITAHWVGPIVWEMLIQCIIMIATFIFLYQAVCEYFTQEQLILTHILRGKAE